MLDQTANRKKTKQKERLLREEVAVEGNVVHDIDSDDEELQHALHASREEEQFAGVVRERGGGRYEHTVVHLNNKGGLLGRLTRSSSQRVKNTPTQTRIDMGPWSTKSKQAKIAIGKA
jgi:hypothetical protein